MKRFLLPLLSICALGFLPLPARALDPSIFDIDAPLTPGLVQLFTDLEAIPAGSTVTDAQHAALVADLTALPPGPAAPTAADLDQLATDLGSLATAGLVNNDAEYLLAMDFEVDPDDQDSWLTYIQGDVDYLLHPPTPYDPNDPNNPIETLDPVIYETAGVLIPRFVSGLTTRNSVSLVKQNTPPLLFSNFSGRAEFVTRQVAGAMPVPKLRVITTGLTPSGPYTVSVTRKSDGANMVIGTFRVHNTLFDKIIAPTPVTLASSSSSIAIPAAELSTSSRTVFGDVNPKKPLPAGYDPADIAAITVTDSQGTVQLLGTVGTGTPSAQAQTLTLRLQGSAMAPTARANATARRTTNLVSSTNVFRLSARHLPASTTVTLLADGVAAGQFTTSAHGRLIVVSRVVPVLTLNRVGGHLTPQSLPTGADLSGATSLSLTDAQGNVLATGSL